ncbi:MAG: 30S ribosomal protein S16 [Patescibacteria group bacterium]|nr:30S ribosomal protein S16 [Patescibacteria group bacterium]
MLAIRLQRVGTKNRPSYRVVVSETKRDLYGRHNEILGNYDPVAQPKTVNLKADRIKHWLSVGAKPSATVHNLLVKEGIVEGKKVKAWKPKKKAVDEKAAAAAPQAEAPAPKAEPAPAQEAEAPAKEEVKEEAKTEEEKTA